MSRLVRSTSKLLPEPTPVEIGWDAVPDDEQRSPTRVGLNLVQLRGQLSLFLFEQVKGYRPFVVNMEETTALSSSAAPTATGSSTTPSSTSRSWTRSVHHGRGKSSCSSWATSSSISTTTTKPSASASGCHDRRRSEHGLSRKFLVMTPARYWRRREWMCRA